MADHSCARRPGQAAASAVRLVVSARLLAACSSNPLIALACVDVSGQDHDGGGR
jgi:hypothetical protein